MGKKPDRHAWPEAKKLCRLNQNDIEMAKRLGFGPDRLLSARPSPKERWKLPVKEWIHELYAKKFGAILGPPPATPAKSQPRGILSDGKGLVDESHLIWSPSTDLPAPSKPRRFTDVTDEDLPF